MIVRRIESKTTCSKCGATTAHKYCDSCRGDKNGIDNYYNNNVRDRRTKIARMYDIFEENKDFLIEICKGECVECGSKKKKLVPFFKTLNMTEDIDSLVRNIILLCEDCLKVKLINKKKNRFNGRKSVK